MGCACPQKAAIDDFPQRLAALQEEHRAQQGLYQQAKKEAQRLRSDLRKAEKELQEKQDMSETLEETIAEMRAHLKEASEVGGVLHASLAFPRDLPGCLGGAKMHSGSCNMYLECSDVPQG